MQGRLGWRKSRRRNSLFALIACVLLAACLPAASGIETIVAPVTLAPSLQPSPSAPAPTPKPTAPLPEGASVYLGVNDVQGMAFALDGSLWAATTGGVAHWNLADDSYVQYTAADGLASDYVTGVAVAPAPQGGTSGSLWFSTGSGVSHFTGSTWTTYTTADGLAAGAPQAVAVTPGGEVWVGTTEGISRFANGVWTSYLPGVRAWDVAVAPDGSIWFANHGAGVNRYTPADDAWTAYTQAGDLPLGGVTALTVGPNGDVWAYENWEGVFRFDGTSWQKAQDHVALVCALAMSPASQGDTGGVPWIGTCGSMHSRFGNLIHAQGDGWTEVEGWHELGQPAIQAMAFGPGDTLAVGTEKGIAVRQDGAWRTLRGGPTRNRMTAVAVTSDGATWFGFGDDQSSAAGGGVSRFDGQSWQYFLGDANVRVLSVAPDGALWAGVGCGVQRYDGRDWQVMASCDDLPLGNVLDFAFGPNGEVWVAKGMNLTRYDGQTWQDMDKMAFSIAATPDGTLWASGWEGAQDSYYTASFDGSTWTKTLDSSLGWLVATPDGAVWGVDSERGLVRFAGEMWEPVPGADGWPVHGSLVVAPDGALWVNGPGGLARFDGQSWAVYPATEGVQALAVAPDGTVWLGTSNGVVHLHPDETQPRSQDGTRHIILNWPVMG
jgi:ligand-binding sensor domain-containing protein